VRSTADQSPLSAFISKSFLEPNKFRLQYSLVHSDCAATESLIQGVQLSDIEWVKLRDLSLAKSTRAAGFDISVHENYSNETQQDLRKRAIKEILSEIDGRYWDEVGSELKEVRKGVYVIALSNPFTIEYDRAQSEIIYIGQGNICLRLKSHFEKSLFDFMESLSGANFNFWICEPKRKGGGKSKFYYKHIEYLLLEEFRASKQKENCAYPYPLLNKNAGSNKDIEPGKGWNKPLKASGKRPTWVIKPTKYWSFRELD